MLQGFFGHLLQVCVIFSDFLKDAYMSLKMLQTRGIFVVIFCDFYWNRWLFLLQMNL
jgi:hypothetical protein